MAYGDIKDLYSRTAKNPKYDGYQRDLVSMVNNFFDKNTAGSAAMHPKKSAVKMIISQTKN